MSSLACRLLLESYHSYFSAVKTVTWLALEEEIKGKYYIPYFLLFKIDDQNVLFKNSWMNQV